MLRLPSAAARAAFLLAVASTLLAADPAPPANPAPPRLSLPQEFPQIEGYGSVVALPEAGERPRIGGRVVLDTTAAAPAGKPNRGLESAARLVNLYVKEGLAASRPRLP